MNKFKEEIKKLSLDGVKQNDYKEELFLFVSFDLTDSTAFKANNQTIWPVVFYKFYELANRELKAKFIAKLWKYVGDEVLFYIKVRESTYLFDIVPSVRSISQLLAKELTNIFHNMIGSISIKSSVWIAPIITIKPQDLTSLDSQQFKNILIFSPETDSESVDFLGEDVDLGFRISNYSEKNQVVVSAELAYMIENMETPPGRNKKALVENLGIVSYEQLKGIWKDRYYPIIWFNENMKNILDEFEYDAPCRSNILERLKYNKPDPISEIGDIFAHLKIETHDLMKLIPREPIETEDIILVENIPRSKLAEVHCVATIFRNDGKLLIAKRPSHKKRLPDLWEFGCGQLKYNMSFEDCLIDAYKEDFGIEIKVDPLTSISTYTIYDEKENRKIPGIIFLGYCEDGNALEQCMLAEKHSEYRWIGEQDIENLDSSSLVDNGINTIKKAFSAFKLWNSY